MSGNTKEERPVMEIPGYYYDKLKQKYFKIKQSADANSAYSSQDVKRRKVRDEREAAEAVAAKQHMRQIRRSRILHTSLPGMAREIGYAALDSSVVLAAGFTAQRPIHMGEMFWNGCGESPLFETNHRPDIGSPVLDVFGAFDSQFISTRIDASKQGPSIRSIDQPKGSLFSGTSAARSFHFNHPGSTTSLTKNEVERRIAMTWLAGCGDYGIAIIPMPHSDCDDIRDMPMVCNGPGNTRGGDVDVLSSTSALPNSSLLFALGSSRGLLTIDRNCDTKYISPDPIDLDNNQPKDVFALEFLPENPDVLLSGSRAGRLHITDLRAPESGSHSDFMLHPSSITHIKSIDPHRVVVAGLNSTLCQYDLRFRKNRSSAPVVGDLQNQRNMKMKGARFNQTATQPTLTYPEYWNTSNWQLGFDVELESGIIAAAQETDQDHPAVRLFSIRGGQALRSLDITHNPKSEREKLQESKCIRFVKDTHGTKSLWISQPNGFERLSWHGPADKD